MSRSRLWTPAATVALLAGLLGACATNPVTGRSEVSLVTAAQEVEIGKQGYAPSSRSMDSMTTRRSRPM